MIKRMIKLKGRTMGISWYVEREKQIQWLNWVWSQVGRQPRINNNKTPIHTIHEKEEY